MEAPAPEPAVASGHRPKTEQTLALAPVSSAEPETRCSTAESCRKA